MIEFNLAEAKKYLDIFYNTNLSLSKKGKFDNYALQLVGLPGIGKTEIVRKYAEEIGVECHVIRLSQFDELSQLVGYPFIEISIHKDGNKLHINEKHLTDYIKNGWQPCDEKSRMAYSQPEWVGKIKEGDILFFDDFSRQIGVFNNAVMEIIKEKENLGWSLPNGVSVFLSSNPNNGEYDIRQGLDDAQADRIIPIYIKWDKHIWAKYADEIGIPSEFINFILLNTEAISGSQSEKFENSSTARRWTNFFIQCSLIYPDIKNKLPEITELGLLHVGSTINLFVNFIKENYDRIVSPEELMDHTIPLSKVLDRVKESIQINPVKEISIRNIITFRLTNFILKIINNKSISIGPEIKNRIKDLVLSELFEKDNIAVLLKTLATDGRFNSLTLELSSKIL